MHYRKSASDSLTIGGGPCGCSNTRYLNGLTCSSGCLSCACCCSNTAFVADYSDGVYTLCLPGIGMEEMCVRKRREKKSNY